MNSINLNSIIAESLKDNKLLFISSAFLFIGFGLEQLLFPKYCGDFIDGLSVNSSNISLKQVLVVLSPYIISQIFFYVSNTMNSQIIPKIEFEIINKLVKKSLNNLNKQNKEINHYELMNNLEKIFELKNIYHQIVSYFLTTILVTAGVVIYFYSINKKTGLVATLLFFVVIFIFYNLSKKCLHISKESETDVQKYLDELNDVFSNTDTILTSNSIDHEIQRIQEKEQEIYINYTNSELSGSNVKSSVAGMSIVILVVLNVLMIKSFLENKITKGQLVSVFFIILLLLQYYDGAAHESKNLLDSMASYKQVCEYFSKFSQINTDTYIETGINDINDIARDFVVQTGEIQFENISLKYNDRIIMENLNLKIKPNQKTALIGEIGTGKTSLLKILQKLIPYTGNVYIDSKNIKNIDSEQIRQNIVYVPQNSSLFNRSIWENLTYGTNQSTETILQTIDNFNLSSFFSKFSDSYDTIVGKNGGKISGGQRQIILILRAILQNKKIILMDEPTSALDNYHKEIFFDIMTKINDKTILIVTHDEDVMQNVDEIINLDKFRKKSS